MKLSEKLIALRKEQGWSQEDFAEKLEVSRQAVSRWENETALPDAQNLLRISRLFRVSADYLLNDGYEEKQPTEHPEREEAPAAPVPAGGKKRRWLWFVIPAACVSVMLLLGVLAFIQYRMFSNREPSVQPTHSHPELIRVIENQVMPTCTTQGSYDEVLYCAECGLEVLRTTVYEGTPSHQFENQICVICGKEQRERN